MISISTKSIFEIDGMDVLVNPVNCEGVMGAGLAKQFAVQCPDAAEHYQRVCTKKLLKPGMILVSRKGIPAPVVIHAATKDTWILASEMSWVESCLLKIKKWALDNPGASIALPLLGAGLGKLDKADVEQLTYSILSDIPNDIVISIP